MPETVFDNLDQLRAAVGRHLGYSEWLEITQERIDQFADATGDHQWIHVDRERAATGPFGGTIAHGYLIVALSNLFLPQIVEVRSISMGINYGTNKIRFPAPVGAGARIRAGAELLAADAIAGGVQSTILITIEVEGADKPACVIESVSRFMA
jgi:acyl dehydratase